MKNNTIRKNIILNRLYSTDMHVSLEKLGAMLEHETNVRYKLVNTGNNTLPLSFANKDNQTYNHFNSLHIKES